MNPFLDFHQKKCFLKNQLKAHYIYCIIFIINPLT